MSHATFSRLMAAKAADLLVSFAGHLSDGAGQAELFDLLLMVLEEQSSYDFESRVHRN